LGPPSLKYPEWFLRNIVNQKVMEELLDGITRFYDDLFMEVVYRAHHNSFKVSYADVFYNDFVNYIVKAYRLKRRKHFFKYLEKPREKRKHHMFGDIRWSLDFWLSQLSFWYGQ